MHNKDLMKRLEVRKSIFTTAGAGPWLLAASLSGTVVLGAQAQTQSGKGKARGTIQDAEIEIVKDRVNTLPEATRNFEKIRLAPPPAPSRQVTYTYPDFRLPPTRLAPSVQVLTIAQEELTPLTGNYLKLGLGNYGTIYGRAHLHSTRNDQYSYGLDLRHQSSATGPVDGKNSGVSQTSVAANGEIYRGTTALGASLDYAHDVYHFYGYQPSPLGGAITIPDADDIKQSFNRVGIRAYARNRTPGAALTYEAGLGYKYWNDKSSSSSESNFLVDAKAGYALSENSRITLQADGSFVSENENSTYASGPRSRNFIQATSAYELTSKTGLSLILGATFGYSSEPLGTGANPGGVGKGMINPAVRVGYSVVPEKVQLYAGAGGAIQRVSRYDLTQENPWLKSGTSQSVADTHYGPTVFIGFTATPTSGLELAARATYGRTRNLYFYNNYKLGTDNQGEYSYSYNLVYDSTSVGVFAVHGELQYSNSEKWRAGLKADYNHYGVSSLAHPYGRPAFLGKLYATYNVTDKLLLGADFYYYSPNYGTAYVLRDASSTYPGNYPIVPIDRQTDAVVDLSLRADYRITPKFSIFALGNNLTNRHYQRYLNYQSQGINVIGGLTYSF